MRANNPVTSVANGGYHYKEEAKGNCFSPPRDDGGGGRRWRFTIILPRPPTPGRLLMLVHWRVQLNSPCRHWSWISEEPRLKRQKKKKKRRRGRERWRSFWAGGGWGSEGVGWMHNGKPRWSPCCETQWRMTKNGAQQGVRGIRLLLLSLHLIGHSGQSHPLLLFFF